MPITALGFLAVFGIGCLVTLKRPFIGLLLYFFVFYMHPPGKYWGAFLPEMRWTLIVALITIFSTLINVKNLSLWLKPKESKILLIFFVYVCLQMLWVDFPAFQEVYAVLLFKFVLLYFLLLTLVTTVKRMVAVLVTNAVGAGYIGFSAFQTHMGGRFEVAGLPSIGDGNLLSIHIVPIIILASVIILTSIKRKFLILLPLAFATNLLFLTGSRGGLVGLVAAGLVLVWYTPREIKLKVYKWASIALILGIGFAGPVLIERIQKVTNADETSEIDKSAYSRFVIIGSQWEMFKDYPLLGFGHRGTLLLSPLYVPDEYMTQTEVGGRRASHNIIMAILVDHGLIGAALFFCLMFLSLKKLKNVNKNYSKASIPSLFMLGSGAGLVGVLVSSQFSNSKVLEISLWLVAFIIINNELINKIKYEELSK
jgi:O-antigen ligase